MGLGGNCAGLNLGAERRRPEALRLLQPINWQFGVHGRSGLGALNNYTEASHQQPPPGKKKSISLICGSACLNKTFQRLPSDKEQPAGLIATAGFALPGNFPARKKMCQDLQRKGAHLPGWWTAFFSHWVHAGCQAVLHLLKKQPLVRLATALGCQITVA